MSSEEPRRSKLAFFRAISLPTPATADCSQNSWIVSQWPLPTLVGPHHRHRRSPLSPVSPKVLLVKTGWTQMAGQHLIGESVVQDLPQNSWFEFSITFFVESTPSSTLLHYDASSILYTHIYVASEYRKGIFAWLGMFPLYSCTVVQLSSSIFTSCSWGDLLSTILWLMPYKPMLLSTPWCSDADALMVMHWCW